MGPVGHVGGGEEGEQEAVLREARRQGDAEQAVLVVEAGGHLARHRGGGGPGLPKADLAGVHVGDEDPAVRGDGEVHRILEAGGDQGIHPEVRGHGLGAGLPMGGRSRHQDREEGGPEGGPHDHPRGSTRFTRRRLPLSDFRLPIPSHAFHLGYPQYGPHPGLRPVRMDLFFRIPPPGPATAR
jgi:hypothetical protein